MKKTKTDNHGFAIFLFVAALFAGVACWIYVEYKEKQHMFEPNGCTKQYNDSINRLTQFEDHMDSLRCINEKLFDKYQQTICIYKGHVFEPCDDKNPYRKKIIEYGGFAISGSSNSGTFAQITYARRASINRKLIETPDSSYIMFYPENIDKFCYRCSNYISIPQKPKYIKTVWKR
jgi:hypothetical protein